MRVISVDPAVRSTGVFIRTPEERRAYRIQSKPKVDGNHALANLHMKLYKLCVRHYPFDLGLVEAYPIGAKFQQGSMELGAAYGIVRAVMAAFDIPIVAIHPSTWQSLTTGRMPKGNKAKTAAYVGEVERRYRVRFETTDCADAYLIWRAARQLIDSPGRTEAQEKLRSELLAALDKND